MEIDYNNIDEKRVSVIISTYIQNTIRDIKANISFLKYPIVSMIKLAILKSSIEVVRKDGKRIKIQDKDEFFRQRFKFLNEKSYESNYVVKRGSNNDILLRIPLTDNGDIYRAFVNEDYLWLKAKEHIVIDIGAGVGDSALLFALWGAEKVYAFEPFPSRFEEAKANVIANNLQHKIELHNSGVGSPSQLLLDSDYIPSNSSNVSNHTSKASGQRIEILDLKSIVEMVNSRDLILKMDCEGCEYSAIMEASCDVLQNFKQIQVEYHYGYKNIQKKLEECGFLVSHTKPKLMRDRDLGLTDLYLGYLRAVKK